MTNIIKESFLTKRVHLRPVTFEDAGEIYKSYAQDSEVTKYLVWTPHVSKAETIAYVTNCVFHSSNTATTYVLITRDRGEIVGALDLRRPVNHRLEFGYVLTRRYWGQGLMTEVLSEVVNWALSQPVIYRVGATCDVDNIASARVMEKAGLSREGLLQRWLIHPNISDSPRDCFSYACVR